MAAGVCLARPGIRLAAFVGGATLVILGREHDVGSTGGVENADRMRDGRYSPSMLRCRWY